MSVFTNAASSTPEELERTGVHAERGEESVAHMMRLYAGHDLLHLQQIDRIRAAVARDTPPPGGAPGPRP